jgi:cytochrome c oxidase assembly factor CtaG
MKLSWWCSAGDTPWEWVWRPYPGVWLMVLFLLLGYWRRLQRASEREPLRRPVTPAQIGSFLTAVLVIWAATDWPLGALGASYLLTVHTISFILLALIAPPLLLYGWPSAPPGHTGSTSWLGKTARFITRPLLALAIFNLVLLVSHLPPVVDGLMPLQLGSFAIDMAWLLGGLTFWFPVVRPGEGGVILSYPKRMLYLFAGTLLPTVPAAFMTFADYPIYGLYELAPRVHDISARDDQQVAGLTMKIIGDLPYWLAFALVFFRWAREESDGKGPSHPSAGVPAALA